MFSSSFQNLHDYDVVSIMKKSMAKTVGECLCFQTLETKYSQVVVLNGLHMPGASEIVQSHKIVVNNPLCGKHRSYVTNDIELRLKVAGKYFTIN